MATIQLCRLTLRDGMPGSVNPNLGVPANGWDNTKDNFVTTSGNTNPAYPPGTKVMSYTDNTNCPGWYTMAYLAFHCATNSTLGYCVSKDFSTSWFLCSHVGQGCASHTMFDNSSAPWYVMGNCYSSYSSDLTCGSPVAIPCASLGGDGSVAAVQGYGDAFGWFWVGGVCPVKDVTILDNKAAIAYKGVDITASADRGELWCGTLTAGIPLLVGESTVGCQLWASACAG